MKLSDATEEIGISARLVWHDDSSQILVCNLEGEFGFDTYAVLEGKLPMMVRDSSHHVDIVFYLTKGASLPPITNLIKELEILMNVMPPNCRQFVCIAENNLLSNPFVVQIANVLKRIIFSQPRKICFASSIEAVVKARTS